MLEPASEEDLDDLHALVNAIEAGDGVPYRTSREEVAEYLQPREDDPALDLRVVRDGAALIAWGHVHHRAAGERGERARLAGGVHPGHRGCGLGRTVLAWQTERARDRLMATPDHLPAIVLAERYEGDDGRGRLFARAGYTDARYFDELHRALDDLPALIAPDGVTIVPWERGHDSPTRLVYNAAFADHWGSTPRSERSWQIDVLDSPNRRLDLSFVAVDRGTGEVVGYALNAHYPLDEAVTGRRDGWIDSLATLRSHRGRGVASALVTRSLHAFAGAGLDSAMLGVDTENLTGANRVYERLGFRRLRRGITSVLTVRRGAEALS